MKIDAKGMYYRELNEIIAKTDERAVTVDNVNGQRYIGAALSGYELTLNGTPGNALAAYMNDSTVIVNGNAQDATADTMNTGRVIIRGRCGDTCGYGMRGGEIFIRDDTGYRTGIHMKEYKEMRPVIVVGGKAGDFLGEYLAGGMIIIFGRGTDEAPVGRFCGTGMHGGVIYLHGDKAPADLPRQVKVEKLTDDDRAVLRNYAERYCGYFGGEPEKLLEKGFVKLLPNSANPYKQLYNDNW